MKQYRFIIECDADFLPTIDLSGEPAGDLARKYLTDCTIARLWIDDITPLVGEIIPIDRCDCALTSAKSN